MKYDPQKHHRRNIRLRGYDYRRAGAYFITICTQDRQCLFGEVVDKQMRLNDAGKMIQATWEDIPIHYCGIETDVFVIMPNHFHAIIKIVGAGPCACPDSGQPRGVAPTGLSLPDIVHRFKTMTTKRYTDGVKHLHWQPFRGRLWQRNYYEHIIRNDESLHRIREYVANNPLQWDIDRENPNFVGAAPGTGPTTSSEPWSI